MPLPILPVHTTRVAVATLALAALSTLADWIWAGWIPDGAVVPGVIHGVVFFAALAVALGWAVDDVRAIGRLLRTLPLAGLVLAAAFYPLATVAGYLGALLLTWTGMWLAVAWLQRRAVEGLEPARHALVRGLAAAAGSGLAFWVVSGMWTRPASETGYGLRLVYWTFAFLPGMSALLLTTRQRD